MTAKYVTSDPISQADIKGLLNFYDRELTPLAASILTARPVAAIGTSGTLENIAAMCAAYWDRDSQRDPMLIERQALTQLLATLLESRSEDRARNQRPGRPAQGPDRGRRAAGQ